MSDLTENRIMRLCDEAIAAKTEEDVERVLAQLRFALEEHMRLAKDSLAAQARAFPLFDSSMDEVLS